MKDATLDQGTKILSLFKDTPEEKIQAILEKGLIADLRDGNIAETNRDKFREILGLKPLSAPASKPIERIRIINATTTIEVNLDAPPNLPFNGAKIEFQIGNGWVKIEKRSGGLYIDGRKVILYLSERQKGGKTLRGYELREELSGKPVLHPNILDALYEHQQLIPEDWKKDENGNIRFIFFWGVIFRNAGGSFYVRYLYFSDGRWDRSYDWLGYDWGSCGPAALLAS